MQPLIIFYNEHSSPPTTLPQGENIRWKSFALELFSCLRKTNQLQPKLNINFPNNSWHEIYEGKPLSVWIKEWLGKDKYEWLLLKMIKNTISENETNDIYYNDIRAVGLTCSFFTASWVFSFPEADSPWASPSINASEYYLNPDNEKIKIRACTINNLAQDEHVEHWKNELEDWGLEIAESNIIAYLDALPIVMYPNDHGYPHIHLINPNQYDQNNHRKTLAKFRIDNNERIEGKPKWDTQIKEWINNNKELLLRSWNRCKKGGHPYRVD